MQLIDRLLITVKGYPNSKVADSLLAKPAPPPVRPRLLVPWRRRVQGLGVLLLLVLPWLRLGGESVLRFDLPAGIFYFAGRTLRLEEFYFLGLGLFILLFLFLLLTLALGRVWCGWLCPQTWLAELSEGAARRLGLAVSPRRVDGPLWRLVLWHLFALAVALVPAAGLVVYFMPPELYWRQLAAAELGPWPLGFTVVLIGLFYADQVFLRRLACLDFCPYGRFQAILLDAGTLTLQLPSQQARLCLNCRACVRVCPMGLDIRRGYQGECINCATCLDACRKVMARRRQPGLIRYTFGLGDRGWRALLSPRLLLLCFLLLAAVTAAVYLSGHRSVVSMQLNRVVEAEPRLRPDGAEIHLFAVRLGNRGNQPGSYHLQAQTAAGRELEMLGPGAAPLALGPGERRRWELALVLPPPTAEQAETIYFRLLDGEGREQAGVRLTISFAE